MGNFKTNGLLQCRLNGLSRILKRVQQQNFLGERATAGEQNLYFWLDTYCVPVKGREGRQTALRLMRKAYQAAHLTIILDDELRSLHLRSDVEAALSIIGSAWASRFWTLEEIVLAQRPFVQFANSLIDLKHLLRDIVNMGTNGCKLLDWCRAARGASTVLFTWVAWDDLDSNGLSARRYYWLIRALRGRSASDPKDEPFCLATILGIPTRSILDCPLDQRMQEFWRAQTQIPKGLLYIRAPKLHDEGLRWAPSTLLGLNLSRQPLWMGEKLATFSDNGLDLVNRAIRFASPGRTVDWPIAFRLPSGKHFQLVAAEDQLRYKDIALDTMTSLAILYPADFMPSTSELRSTEDVALVQITAEYEDRIEASYLSVFLLLGDQRPLLPNAASTCVDGTQIEARWRIS